MNNKRRINRFTNYLTDSYYTFRSSHPEVFLEKGVLKI